MSNVEKMLKTLQENRSRSRVNKADLANIKNWACVEIRVGEKRNDVVVWIYENTESKFVAGLNYVWFEDPKEAMYFRLKYGT